MEELGFESRYMLNNMGTMIIFYIIYPLLVLLHRISKKLKRFTCCRKTKQCLKNSLYYNILIVVVFESYALVALCCIIGLTALKFNSIGVAIQSSICIAFTLWIIIAPILIIREGVHSIETLKLKKTRKVIGKLYETLIVTRGTIIFCQPAFFLVRRILIVIAVTVFAEILIV